MSILLVGVGHVFQIAPAIQALIHQQPPEIVALELDPARMAGLEQRAAGTWDAQKAHASAPRMYRTLAKVQEDIAAAYGTDVGGEMLAGVRAAQAVGARIELIDVSGEESIRRLSAEMTLWEKAKLFSSLVASKFSFGRKRTVEDEIAKYQRDPGAYLARVARAYPTLHRILIAERNAHMGKRLRDLEAGGKRVVALVGDGHVEGLVPLLAGIPTRTIRLAELRKGVRRGLSWTTSPKGDRVSFSFETRAPEGTIGRV